MTKDKQIEEMAKDIDQARIKAQDTTNKTICDKCIHSHICEMYASHGLRIPYVMQFGSDKCVAFKNKTSFIELPCFVIPDKRIHLRNTKAPYYLEISTTYKWKVARICMTLKEARRCEEQVRKEYKDLYGIELKESEDTK